jgi:hypothetical protein
LHFQKATFQAKSGTWLFGLIALTLNALPLPEKFSHFETNELALLHG